MGIVIGILVLVLAAVLLVTGAAVAIRDTNAHHEATRQRVRQEGVDWAHRHYLANHSKMTRTQRAVLRECIEEGKRRYER